jgi:hypothetical protein
MNTREEMGTGAGPIARGRRECAARETAVPVPPGARGKYIGPGPTALLLATALALAGCSEKHAPAATAASGAESPTATKDALAAAPAQQPDQSAADPEASAKSAAAESAAAPTLPGGRGTSDITFDTIKFTMEKAEPFRSEMLTPAIRALDGRRIRVRGYMLPSFQQSGITQFVLVRDNLQCCFGPGAALYDCIVVEMAAGKSTDYKVQPVAVEGTFSLSELRDPDGKHLAIYHLTGEAVR